MLSSLTVAPTHYPGSRGLQQFLDPRKGYLAQIHLRTPFLRHTLAVRNSKTRSSISPHLYLIYLPDHRLIWRMIPAVFPHNCFLMWANSGQTAKVQLESYHPKQGHDCLFHSSNNPIPHVLLLGIAGCSLVLSHSWDLSVFPHCPGCAHLSRRCAILCNTEEDGPHGIPTRDISASHTTASSESLFTCSQGNAAWDVAYTTQGGTAALGLYHSHFTFHHMPYYPQ